MRLDHPNVLFWDFSVCLCGQLTRDLVRGQKPEAEEWRMVGSGKRTVPGVCTRGWDLGRNGHCVFLSWKYTRMCIFSLCRKSCNVHALRWVNAHLGLPCFKKIINMFSKNNAIRGICYKLMWGCVSDIKNFPKTFFFNCTTVHLSLCLALFVCVINFTVLISKSN